MSGDPGGHRLGIFSVSSGKAIRWLPSQAFRGTSIASTATDGLHRIWVTLAQGPVCTSDIAGCGPKPRSCAGRVLRIDPVTGSVWTVLETSPDELIDDAVPSPDRRYLAYLIGECDGAYFDQHVEVERLATGARWSIGAGLAPCHSLRSLSWTRDGTHLAALYGRSVVGSTDPRGSSGRGSCREPAPARLAVVPALAGRSGFSGRSAPAQHGCEIDAVAATAAGYAAIEGCGTLSRPVAVRLLSYSHSLRRSVTASLGPCVNGAQLGSDASGTRLLGVTYQYCDPGATSSPVTVAFTEDAGAVRTFYAKSNGGEDAFTAISW